MAEYILIYSGKPKADRATSGVGLLVHEKYQSNIKDIIYVSDRQLLTTFEFMETTKTHIISVYAPDTSKSQEDRDLFYDDLQNTLNKIPKADEIMILGDLNARIGNEILEGIKNRFNEETLNNSGEQLIQFCAHNELRINNTFYPHKPQHKYTFENTRMQKSVIDYIITNRNIHPSKILDVRTLSSANTGTNHSLVLSKVRCCVQRGRKDKHAATVEKLNIESISEDSTKHLYQQRLMKKITENKIVEKDDVETAWRKLSNNIIAAAEEALGKRRVNINGKPQTKPWFREDIKTLAAEKRKAYLQLRSKTVTYDEYKTVRNRVNTAIQAIKRRFWGKFSSDMEHDLYGGQKRIWNMLRNRKKPVNEYVHTKSITTETWESYFRTLYTNTKSRETEQLDSDTEGKEDKSTLEQIPKEKIKLTIGTLKNRKAPGLDNINNELLKYGGDTLVDEIHTLFNKIYEKMELPEQWKQSITIPVFKKGDKMDPQNYRGISLLSTVSKVFTKILADEILQTGISEEQQGFRQNRSTIDAIFILRQITEKAIEHNKTAFMCFIDLTRAFDRVRFDDVLKLLRKRRSNPKTIEIIRKMNTGNSTYVKSNNTLSSQIPVSTGIRQGDSLSPVLFNVIMDQIISEVKTAGKGYRMGKKEFKIICYADDAVIISEDEDNLQRLLYRFETAANKLNMTISVQKTQSLTISKEPRRCKLAVYNKSVEQVMSFKYLGVNITSTRNLKQEAQNQTIMAARVSGFLRDVIWRNKHMSIESKTRIYKTCVRPIMTYAIETRAETAATKQLLRATEMKTLRSITGKTLRDREKSSDIRALCDIQDVVRWARSRRRAWRDHVDRMADDRLAKQAKEGKPNTRRPIGRPPKRWYESWSSESQLRLQL